MEWDWKSVRLYKNIFLNLFTHILIFFLFYLQEGDDRATSRTTTNKTLTLNSKPSAPKTSSQASQSLRTNPPAEPQPSLSQTNISPSPPQPMYFQSNNSAIQPQAVLPQGNSSPIQPQATLSQGNSSPIQPHPSTPQSSAFPHYKPSPPQNDAIDAPHPPTSSHENNNPVPQASPLAPDLTQQLSFLLER